MSTASGLLNVLLSIAVYCLWPRRGSQYPTSSIFDDVVAETKWAVRTLVVGAVVVGHNGGAGSEQLRVSASDLALGQALPPCAGSLLIVAVRFCIPSVPHVTLHEPQAPQAISQSLVLPPLKATTASSSRASVSRLFCSSQLGCGFMPVKRFSLLKLAE